MYDVSLNYGIISHLSRESMLLYMKNIMDFLKGGSTLDATKLLEIVEMEIKCHISRNNIKLDIHVRCKL